MIILVCAWCKEKMKSAHKWEKLDQSVLKAEDSVISHGICLTCYEAFQENLKQPLGQADPEKILSDTKTTW